MKISAEGKIVCCGQKNHTDSPAPSQDVNNQMIEEAAYFLAEKRHFAPGFEEQDWLEAKQQILAQIKGADSPLK